MPASNGCDGGNRINRKKLRNDIILVVGLIAVCAAAALLITLTRKSGDYVLIIQDGAEAARYPLSGELTVDIPSADGGYNRLVISGGYADVTSASCPDGLCVNQRKISKVGQTIVCLPNRLVIEIASADSDTEVDLIA